MAKGKFIVIDGTDGSGKGTQLEYLRDRMVKENHDVETADFPQYGNPSAFFVEKYLRGEYGTADEVGAYRGSLFYALDRYDASFLMRNQLNDGKIIISNRYVSASMGHQTGKIKDPVERDKFVDWLDNLEYGICNIPRPDLTIFLYVPPEIGQKLVDEKEAREYTKGKKRDIHEADLEHLKNATEAFKYVADKFNWVTIDCTKDGKLMTREEVHELVYSAVKDVL